MTAPRIAACPTCSASLTDGDRFCKQCGTEVSGISAALGIAASAAGPVSSPTASGPSPWEAVLARLRSATMGEFDVGRELGRGGMAAVFLAHDLALNRKVAIKVMAPGLMMGEGMVQRFRQEAITIANLSHAHIVSIHAVRQTDDLHYFVMQFVEGQSLETVLRTNGSLSVPVVRAILYQVGSALAYAHRRGVVHRDVKPGNILMSGDGDALVTDFGIAKVAEGPSQTQTGMVVGTPTYMSPEQCYATEVDGASDQYSLGVVAYQMLTGQTPFSGSAFQIMHGHTNKPVPSLRGLAPDVPEHVEAAILRMLAKTPAERFESFGEALAAMDAKPVGEDAPMRQELIRLAAVEERRAALGSLLHTPTSPLPGSRVRSRGGSTPAPPTAPAPAPPTATAPAPAAETVPITALAIAPIAAELELGDTITMRAAVRGAQNATAVRWRTEPEGIATIDPESGELTTRAVGECSVVATVGDVTEHTLCVVVAPRVADVRITAPVEALHVGDPFALSAQAVDKRERAVDGRIEWSVVGDSVVLEADGRARAEQVGRAAVTATCNGVYSTVVLQVLAARVAHVELLLPPAPLEIGYAVTLGVVLRGAARQELSGRSVNWSVNDDALARIDAAGVLTPLAPGTVRVSATCEGVTASRDLLVPPARTASLHIDDLPDLVRAGDRFPLSATARDVRGVTLDRDIVWQCTTPDVATIDVNGVVTTHAAGRAELVALVDDVRATARLTVSPTPAAFATPADPANAVAPASATAVLSAVASEAAPATKAPVAPTNLQTPPAGAALATPPTVQRGRRVPRWALGAALVPLVAVVVWLGSRGDSASDGQTPSEASSGPADSAALPNREPALAVQNMSDSAVSREVFPADTTGQLAERPVDPTPTRPPTLRLAPPRSTTLRVGETLTLSASVRDGESGRALPLGVEFSTNDRSVAQVDERTGVVSALKTGRVTITARAEGAAATSVRLTVQAADQVAQQSTAANEPAATPRTESSTPERVTPPRPAADTPSAAAVISQAQLAREARSSIEEFATAISSRDISKVRAIYPTISASYAASLSSMFEFSRDVKVTVNSVSLPGGSEYDQTIGARTSVSAGVTFRITPERGSAPPPSNDVWPVTLQRTATGWRLLQVGAP